MIIGSSGGGEGVELFLSFESKLEKLLDDFFQDGYRGEIRLPEVAGEPVGKFKRNLP